MPKNKTNKIFFLFFLLLLLLGPHLVLALEITYPRVPGAIAPQDFIPTALPEEILPLYVSYIFNLIIWISGIIAFGVLVYAGILYLISTGKPEVIISAKNQIIDAFFGILLLLSSFLILQILNPRLTILEIPKPEPVPIVERPAIPPPITELHRSSIDSDIPFGAIIEKIFEKPRMTRIKENAQTTLAIATNLKESNQRLNNLVQGGCKCSNAKPVCGPGCSPQPCTSDTCKPVRGEIESIQNDENLPNIEKLRIEQKKTIEEIRLLNIELKRLEKAEAFMQACSLSKLNSLTQFLDTKKFYISHRWPIFDPKFLEEIKTIEEWASFYCPVSGSIFGEQFPRSEGITEPPPMLPAEVEVSAPACTIEATVGEIIDRTKRTGKLLVTRMEELVKKDKEMIEAVDKMQVLVSQCSSQRCTSVCVQTKRGCIKVGCLIGSACPYGEISGQAAKISQIQQAIEKLVKEEKKEEMGIIPIIDKVVPKILEDLAKEVRKPMKECAFESAVAEQSPELPQVLLSDCEGALRSIGPKGRVIQNCCLEEPEFQKCLDKCYLEEGQKNYKECLERCLREEAAKLAAQGKIREAEIIATCQHTINFYCCGK